MKSEQVSPIQEVPPVQKTPIIGKRSSGAKSDEVRIEGLDQIGNEDSAEVVETDERGLRKRENRPKPRVQEEKNRRAKVNVDLDLLDLGKADRIIVTSSTEDEPMEEIVAEGDSQADPGVAELFSDAATSESVPAASLASTREDFPPDVLQIVKDDNFYFSDALPPSGEAQTPDLENLIAALPEAEVVADCVADWRRRRARLSITARLSPIKTDSGPFQSVKRTKAAPPLWAEPAPEEPMWAVALSETEFQKALADGLQPDPQGEWLSEYAAAGPVPVQPFEEN
jgi:hypothetical protein